jgi:hypothetical protein
VTGGRDAQTLQGLPRNGAGDESAPAPGRGWGAVTTAEPPAFGTGSPPTSSDRGRTTGTKDGAREAAGRPIARPTVDIWVRRFCALVVAGVAAYSSYEHQRRFALHGGADPVSAALWPLSVDGLMVLASLGLLSAHRHATGRARWSVRLAFGLGVAVSLAANVAAAPVLAWQPVVVAGWPPFALVLAVELLMHGQQPDESSETDRPGRTEPTTDLPTETTADGCGIMHPVRSPGCRPQSDADSAADTRGGTSPGQLGTLSPPAAAGNAGTQRPAEDVMWSHFQQERARGRTPTGAELDRVAGTNNYGRAVLARWKRTGRLSMPDGEPPERSRRNGRPQPTDPHAVQEDGPSRRD